MDAAEAVRRLGGVCTWRQLRRAVPWRSIGRAVEAGEVVRLRRGLYGLKGADEAAAVARRLAGTLSHRSAALHWGWKVKTTPRRPDVTLARHRRLPRGARDGATLHWRNLPADQRRSHVTSPARTVVDCCLDLPLDEALSVFDSALRSGLPRREVTALATTLGPRQRARVLRIARQADALAANPFESVLRTIALGVPGLTVEARRCDCATTTCTRGSTWPTRRCTHRGGRAAPAASDMLTGTSGWQLTAAPVHGRSWTACCQPVVPGACRRADSRVGWVSWGRGARRQGASPSAGLPTSGR